MKGPHVHHASRHTRLKATTTLCGRSLNHSSQKANRLQSQHEAGLIAIENLRHRLTFVSLSKANLNECEEISRGTPNYDIKLRATNASWLKWSLRRSYRRIALFVLFTRILFAFNPRSYRLRTKSFKRTQFIYLFSRCIQPDWKFYRNSVISSYPSPLKSQKVVEVRK